MVRYGLPELKLAHVIYHVIASSWPRSDWLDDCRCGTLCTDPAKRAWEAQALLVAIISAVAETFKISTLTPVIFYLSASSLCFLSRLAIDLLEFLFISIDDNRDGNSLFIMSKFTRLYLRIPRPKVGHAWNHLSLSLPLCDRRCPSGNGSGDEEYEIMVLTVAIRPSSASLASRLALS